MVLSPFIALLGGSILSLPIGVAGEAPAAAPTLPQPAAEVARQMKLPAGLVAEAIIDETRLTQPACMHIDGRGRLWVVEYRTYDNKMDRKQTDSVVVFTDSDGDGTYDQRRVFHEGKIITSVAIGLGGVWILEQPDLRFIPDADGDAVADGPAQTVLDGFAFKGGWTNNIVNNLTWGPDGWLYGCSGMDNKGLIGKPGTPPAERVTMAAGVWRYHPRSKAVEVFSRGGTNPFGLDFDADGELFAPDTGPFPLWHLHRGGNYQYEFHKAHISPFAYELLTGTLKRKGREVSSGAVIYQGEAWPAQWRGRFITCNIKRRALTWNTLTLGKAVCTASPDAVLMERPADPWFFGVTLTTTPGGALLLADWSDPNKECHSYPIPERTGGRIFRLAPAGFRDPRVDVPAENDATLIAAVGGSVWRFRQARLELQRRAAEKRLAGDTVAQLRALLAGSDDAPRLRALWMLEACDALGDGELHAMLGDRTTAVRIWALRFLADRRALDVDRVLPLATESPILRLNVASLSRSLPEPARRTLLGAVAREMPADEPLPVVLMTWYALEPLVGADAEWAKKDLAGLAVKKLSDFIQRRIDEGTKKATKK